MDKNDKSSYGQELKSPLKWPGGKRWIVPHVKKHFDELGAKRLVEPFAGGLSVAIGVAPKQALINDINPVVIGFYKNVKKGLNESLRPRNNETYYYRLRDKLNALLRKQDYDNPLMAEYFRVCNKLCFNGLVRFSVNDTGIMKFNVPFGRHASFSLTDLTPYKKLLQNWSFRCTDFEDLSIKVGDLAYLDPPYDSADDKGFTEYAGGRFTWEDQRRLIDWAGKQACPVMISNKATPRIIRLYKENGFAIKTVSVRRSISCKQRCNEKEVIATNF